MTETSSRNIHLRRARGKRPKVPDDGYDGVLDESIKACRIVGIDISDDYDYLKTLRKLVRERNAGQAGLARVTAERDDLRARLTTGIGLPLGVNDRDGNPVHVGDTLAFLGSVWNRGVKDPPDHVFVVRFDRGQVHFDGTVSDIGDYCRIVKRWNEVGP